MLKKTISILLAVGVFLLCCSGCSGCSNKGKETNSDALNSGFSNNPSASQSDDGSHTTKEDYNADATTPNASRQRPGSLKDIKGVTDLSKLPDYLEGSLEQYLTIEADIEVYPEGTYNLYQATLQDTEKVYQKWVDTFIPGKQFASQNHMQDMMLNDDTIPNYNYQDQTIDGESLLISNNFHMFTDNSSKITSIYDDLSNPAKIPILSVGQSESKDIVLRNRFPKEELAEFSKDSALAMVEEKINALGIQNLGNPNVYALDIESVNKWIQNEVKPNADSIQYASGVPTKWTNQNQECYYITYNMMLGGVKFTDSSTPNLAGKVYNDPVMTTGSVLQAFVNQNGVFYFYFGDIYNVKTTQKNLSCISMEQAISVYAEKYKNAFEEEARKMFKIQLLYVPKYEEDFNFELRPAWVISSQTKVNPELPEEEQNYVTKDYVDAITGEMMNYR